MKRGKKWELVVCFAEHSDERAQLEQWVDDEQQQDEHELQCCGNGSSQSHHSPNDVIPLSTTSNVHSQETMTIY